MEEERSSEGKLSLESLPIEIIIHICNYLEPDFILSVLCRVSKRFEGIAFDQALWRIRIARRWPAKFPPVDPDPNFSWSDACAARESFAGQWNEVTKKTDTLSIKAHFASVDALLLVKDGSLLLSGSRDRSLALWKTSEMSHGNSESGLLQKDTTVHKGWVWSLNYSAEKSMAISTGWDYKIHTWDLSDVGLTHQSSINCKTALLCADLHNNNLVTVGTFDKRIKTYDLRMNNNDEVQHIEDFKCHKLPVLAIVTNPNDANQLISASEDGSVALIERRTRKVLKRLHFTKGTYPMCMKPSGRTLYVGDKVGNLHLVDLSTTTPLKRMKTVSGLHSGKVTGVDTHLGGIVTCSSDGKVKLLHPDMSCSLIQSIDSKEFGEVTSISYLNGILASGHSLETIQLWRPRMKQTTM